MHFPMITEVRIENNFSERCLDFYAISKRRADNGDSEYAVLEITQEPGDIWNPWRVKLQKHELGEIAKPTFKLNREDSQIIMGALMDYFGVKANEAEVSARLDEVRKFHDEQTLWLRKQIERLTDN